MVNVQQRAENLLNLLDFSYLNDTSLLNDLKIKINKERKKFIPILKKHYEIDHSVSKASTTGRRTNYVTLVGEGCAISGFFINLFFKDNSNTSCVKTTNEGVNLSEIGTIIEFCGLFVGLGANVVNMCLSPKIDFKIGSKIVEIQSSCIRLDRMTAFIEEYQRLQGLKTIVSTEVEKSHESKGSDHLNVDSLKKENIRRFNIVINKCITLYNHAFEGGNWKGECYAHLVSFYLIYLGKEDRVYRRIQILMNQLSSASLTPEDYSHHYKGCIEYIQTAFDLNKQLPISFINTPSGRVESSLPALTAPADVQILVK